MIETGMHLVSHDHDDMVRCLDSYDASLHRRAAQLKASGEAVSDQRFLDSLLRFRPGHASGSHLLLLGGMGPLAGLYGMRDALALLPRHSLTLYQACSIPPRDGTAVIGRPLYGALKTALASLPSEGEIDLIVLCNSAHGAVPGVLEALEQASPHANRRIRFHSLAASVEQQRGRFHKRGVILQSDFSASSGIHTQTGMLTPLDNIPALRTCQRELAAAIGAVKRFDTLQVVRHASVLFDALRRARIEQILLGCTEVPLIVDIMKREGSEAVRTYLRQTELIDPVRLALQTIKERHDGTDPDRRYETVGYPDAPRPFFARRTAAVEF